MMLTRSSFLFLALVVLVGVLPRPVHARCAAPRPYAELVTQLTEPLPLGANLLIEVKSGHEYGRGPEVTTLPDGAGVEIEGLALVQGDTRIALRSEPIGGGLVRMIPSRPVTAGTYAIVGFTRTLPTGAAAETALEVTFRGELPAPVAPANVTAARHAERSAGETRWGTRTSYRTTFTIDRVLPPSVVRVAFASRDHWVVVPRTGNRELVAGGEYGGSHCGDGHVPGVGRARVGLDVHLVLIDAFGRVVTGTQTVRIR